MKVLLGSHGFIGRNLMKERRFDLHIDSKNLSDLNGLKIDELIIAAPGHFCSDESAYNSIKHSLLTAEIGKVILISTVDVYKTRVFLNEADTPYNRETVPALKRELEQFVSANFANFLILRLPTVYGEGANSTILYNLINEINLHDVNLNSAFQWYNVKNLNNDMTYFSTMGLDIVNMAVEPIETKVVIDKFFPDRLKHCSVKDREEYDIWSIYPSKLLNTFKYFADKYSTLRELEKFIQSGTVGRLDTTR